MADEKMYSIQEAAKKIGISVATVRRRVLDKTIPSVFLSKKEGYRVSEEELNKYAQTLKDNPYYANKETKAKKVAKNNAKGKKSANNANTATVETSTVETQAVRKSSNKSVVTSSDTATEALIGGQLGAALSAMLGAYSSTSEHSLPEDNVKNLIKELSRPTVIDKVIDRLKAEQEYYEIQMAALELEARQSVGKSAKDAAEQKLIEMRLKKNQIGKDITDLEIRKTLLV